MLKEKADLDPAIMVVIEVIVAVDLTKATNPDINSINT
jgi:hypothetical protein